MTNNRQHNIHYSLNMWKEIKRKTRCIILFVYWYNKCIYL